MGIFIVKSKDSLVKDDANSRIVKDEKDLKIVLFLCKTERDRN